MASITAANAIFAVAIPGLIPTPIALQGFSADDIFDTEAVEVAEVIMGADGKLSAGFVYAAVKQTISLQADSASNKIFETLYANIKGQQDVFFMNATVILKSLKLIYTLTNGVMTTYPPMADAKKTLQPRRYGLVWESVSPGKPL